MSRHVPSPDEGSLLPPLLACLPTGSASPRPPPALLPLLSPILRQRVQLLPATSDSWLPLLCWQPGSAEKLASIVGSEVFELHPVSGEIEYGELGPTQYRQLDEETLQARVQIDDLELVVIYLWCEGDQEGGGDGWRVSEVIPLADDRTRDQGLWSPSIAGAREAARSMIDIEPSHVPRPVTTTSTQGSYVNDNENTAAETREDDDDDDDYWAQYDKTPGRTPAMNRSPMRGESSATAGRARATSEAEYFEQYSQVQPEMDNDDPSENRENIGESSLNGNIMTNATSRPPIQEHLPNGFPPQALVHDPIPDSQSPRISEPTASSPTALSDAVSRLEDSAIVQSNAEVAIRQHVSTTIKSLFRLCRTSGIDRPEFDELVKTELESLSILTGDD